MDCGLFRCCFKTNFGIFKPEWITTENVFTAQQRKGNALPMLAEVFRADPSLYLEEKRAFVNSQCSPCGTKLKNRATMLLLKDKLNK